jgi:hypothetical protein
MKKAIMSLMAVVCLAGLALAAPSRPRHVREEEFVFPVGLVSFDGMYGVDGPFVGDANPIRGVVGDELPWVIRSGRGALGRDGHLRIRVRGLVFADDASVPPELRGINDEATFRALVSCLSEDAAGQLITANVTTDGFPATVAGDSDINAMIDLPNPCVAPIVFVLSGSEDKWFAVMGHESKEN